MELTARVSAVLPLLSGTSPSTGNQWQKATVVVEWQDGQFTKKLALTNMKKASEFATLQVYQDYKFKIDVTSREHNGKWYTEASCFAWEPIAAAVPQPAPQPAPSPQPVQQPYSQPNAAPSYPIPSVPTPPPPQYNPIQPSYGYPTAPTAPPF